MKPLQLKIKGLNSFLDEQTIDFSCLSDRGLFGIFGPTGSGKSSILDAITLALYGKVPRAGGQLGGIVNTQTDTTQVVYDFALGEGEARRFYRVQRSFKRNVNRRTGNEGVSTKSAGLYDISDSENPQVLFEGQREVNAGVEALVGLSAEDFTRSVVLPQGSFSEFLKMTGADRGQMLERIFALEEYGEKMTIRIKRIKGDQYIQAMQMEALLSSYADISPEIYNSKEEELKLLRQDMQVLETLWQTTEQDYQQFKSVWEGQEELKSYQLVAGELHAQQTEMNRLQVQLEKAERATMLRPLLERLEPREKLVAVRTAEMKVLGDQLKSIHAQLILTGEKFNQAKHNQEMELPAQREKLHQLEMALKIEAQISLLQTEYEHLRQQYQTSTHTVEGQKTALEQKQNQITALRASVLNCRQQLDTIKISPELREKIGQAYEEERQYRQEQKMLAEIQPFITSLETSLIENEAQRINLTDQYLQKENEQQRLLLEKHNLEHNCPGQKDDLLNLQQKINKEQQEIEQLIIFLAEAEQIQQELNQLAEEKQTRYLKVAEEQALLAQQEAKRQDCQLRLEISRDKNMAWALASKLVGGEACPVCGSAHHPAPAGTVEILAIEALEKEKLLLEQQIQQQQNKARQTELELRDWLGKEEHKTQAAQLLQDKIAGRQLAPLQELVKSKESNFIKLKEEISGWEEKCRLNDEHIAVVKERTAQLATELATQKTGEQKDRELLANKQFEAEQIQVRLEATQKEYLASCLALGFEQMEDHYRQMQENDRQAEALEKELRALEIEMNSLEAERATLQDEINQLELSRTEIITSGKEKSRLMEQKRAELQAICGELSPASAVAAQQGLIEAIEKDYQLWQGEYESARLQEDQLKQQYATLEGDLRALAAVLEEERWELEQGLKTHSFKDRAELIANFQEENVVDQLRNTIRAYFDRLNLNQADLARVEQRLAGLCIAEDEWQAIQQKRQALQENLSEMKNHLLIQATAQQEVARRLQARQEIESKKQSIDHKYGLIEELENLFKGKKFVEFIARTQLSYIAREASAKLRDITRGRYALELNGEGDFIVRDDFNGGVRRATHTLSGGETFLTSLALALALSSHIQLGRASLEFFFLDEGFGTLDAETLEIVIDSLERLHSEKLTVGVISHVEELKQRMPRRLIVTQAIPGISGSTVAIE